MSVFEKHGDVIILVAILSVPFVLGGLMLAWFNGLPPAERARFERTTQ